MFLSLNHHSRTTKKTLNIKKEQINKQEKPIPTTFTNPDEKYPKMLEMVPLQSHRACAVTIFTRFYSESLFTSVSHTQRTALLSLLFWFCLFTMQTT